MKNIVFIEYLRGFDDRRRGIKAASDVVAPDANTNDLLGRPPMPQHILCAQPRAVKSPARNCTRRPHCAARNGGAK